jgi:hypothetical protein
MRGGGQPGMLWRFEERQNFRCELGDGARSQGQDCFSGLCHGHGGLRRLLKGTCIVGRCSTASANARGKLLSGNTWQGGFASSVNIEYEDGVGQCKRFSEVFHQGLGAGIAMGLKDDVNPFIAALAGGGQRSANFGGMVPVIVNDRDPVRLSAKLKPPVHSPEACKGVANVVWTQIQSHSDCDGSSGIAHVVNAGNLKLELAQVGCAKAHAKTAERRRRERKFGSGALQRQSRFHFSDMEVRTRLSRLRRRSSSLQATTVP